MITQQNIDYDRIARAIEYISSHFRDQPDLEEVARKIHISPFHFQRMFTDWAGVSPKKFLQYITVGHARRMLKEQQATVFDAAVETGLSGTGRLHDLFVTIEGMTPGEYRNGGENLYISYSFPQSPFGNMVVASTAKGICHMAFADRQPEALADLKERFPNASFRQTTDMAQQKVLSIFTQDWNDLDQVKLHLKGTAFQLKVWETLLKIPMGRLTCYSDIANRIGKPEASRAVGTAIGRNPVAFLIPCHRVIQSTGTFGNYMWGPTRKTAMIAWEAAKTDAGAVES